MLLHLTMRAAVPVTPQSLRMQLPEVSQPPSLPLPGSGEPAIALDGASFAWKAASEGGQATVLDVTLEVLLERRPAVRPCRQL